MTQITMKRDQKPSAASTKTVGQQQVVSVPFRFIYLVAIVLDMFLSIILGLVSFFSVLLTSISIPLIGTSTGSCHFSHELEQFMAKSFPRLPFKFVEGENIHAMIWIAVFQFSLILFMVVVGLGQHYAWIGYKKSDVKAAFLFILCKKLTAIAWFLAYIQWSSIYLYGAFMYNSIVALVGILFTNGLIKVQSREKIYV